MTRVLRAVLGALLFAWTLTAHAQAASGAASSPQFPQLPLRRDEAPADAGASLAWAGLVLIAGAALAFAWKRRGRLVPRAGAGIGVQAGRPLTQHASLHVVEWEGERLLVACTPHSVDVLARRPAAPESAS